MAPESVSVSVAARFSLEVGRRNYSSASCLSLGALRQTCVEAPNAGFCGLPFRGPSLGLSLPRIIAKCFDLRTLNLWRPNIQTSAPTFRSSADHGAVQDSTHHVINVSGTYFFPKIFVVSDTGGGATWTRGAGLGGWMLASRLTSREVL